MTTRPTVAEPDAGGPAAETLAATERLTAEVRASFDQAPGRLRTLTSGLVAHLHAFVTEHDLTEAEWQVAIRFLTAAGHITTDTRQEFILLSDTLGVSSLVDLLTNSRTPEATPSAVLGPFYVEGPPAMAQGADLSGGDLPGEPVYAQVRITDTTGVPIAGAVVDAWQANEDGFYDVQLPELEGPVLRGRLESDADGWVRFWTILPAPYPIPNDGPVGRLLDAVGRHPMRAPHVHFMITTPDRPRLVTQLFVAGGDYLDSDAVFGVKEALIIDFPVGEGAPPDGRDVPSWRRLDFTFSLADPRSAG